MSAKPVGGINELRLVNVAVLAGATRQSDTEVGGLSGIDFDPVRNLYYLVCDDPSTKGPSRYYTARIDINEKGIQNVEITGMVPLLDAKGNRFSDITRDRFHSADVEALRYDAKRDELVWSSEGQRFIRDGKQELQDPQIVITRTDGHFKDSFELPPNMRIRQIEKGPRHNSVFEGLCFDDDFSHLYVSLEEPIYEDGPRAGGGDSTAWIRILKFHRGLRQAVAQYAYRVDAVPHPAIPPGAFKINGVSDIMWIGENKLLVIERGYSVGRGPSDIRVYLADLGGADDVTALSLAGENQFRPVSKRLLLDFNSLGIFVDNVEGATFGPVLPNGRRSLLFVTDDNFSAKQKTQFFLFEILR